MNKIIDKIKKALNTANRVTDPWEKHYALREIAEVAKAQAQDGDIQGALTTTNLITDAYWESDALIAIAQTQAECGDNDGALSTLQEALRSVNRMDCEYLESQALKRISILQFGDIDRALKTASCITIDWIRYEAIKNIAKAQAKDGDTPGALNTASRIDYDWDRNDALRDIAKVQAQGEDIEGALRTASLIDYVYCRNGALHDIETIKKEIGVNDG